ncbi:MAG: hypothetical protein LBK18_03305, partial [Prevotellaceae bacterium]|nr:hypothetical protein [Prevotellaceae bacterium]
MKHFFTALLLLLASAGYAGAAGIYYVKDGGSGDGASWSNAAGDLQEMINAAGEGDEIWVAAGTYKPNRSADNLSIISASNRDNAFVMKASVKLYGGFPADATDGDGMEVRDWRLHPTVLSGDLGGDDSPGNLTNREDNAYHVVIAAGSMVSGADTACLDGFVVMGGHADGYTSITVNDRDVNKRYGGGIYSVGTAMLFANDSVAGSYGSTGGGGIYATTDTSTYANVAVSGNTATTNGGGVHIDSGSPAFTNARISGNIAHTGGGVFVMDGSPAFTNALISGNTAGSNGGGVYAYSGTPAFTNATVAGNYAGKANFNGEGGGMYQRSGTVTTLNNSIVGGNNTNTPGSNKNIYGFYIASYSLVHGNSRTGTGVITNAAPLFVFPDTAKADAPTTGGNYRLQPGSLAIDAGSSSLNSTTKDLDGNPRVQGCTVDMGAYESPYMDSLSSTNGVVYVSVDGAGNKDGSSWSNAYPGLARPLYLAQSEHSCGGDSIKEIWVLAGTYKPAYAPGSGTSNRDVAFAMKPGVKLYGGFPASATDGDGMEVRDWRLHPTVLSGDLDGNDSPGNLTNKDDNAYHVVIAAGSMVRGADTACLDGFVVTGGYANGSYITVNGQRVDGVYGGGIHSAGTAMRFANDSVAGCYSFYYGGGIYATADTSTYANVAVSGNTAGSYGGGVYVVSGTPAFTSARISGNTAGSYGGGVYVSSGSPAVTNARVGGNAANRGGGMYVGGGSPAFINALISGNTANSNGGGVYVDNGTPAFTNATVAGNYAKTDGGGVYSVGGTVTLNNSIVGGNNSPGSNKNIYNISSASYSLVQSGSVSGEGVIANAAPLFAFPDTAKDNAPTVEGDYHLQHFSPAIDAGNNDLNSTTTDLDGNPRKRGYAVDMGAYESFRDSLGNANGVVYVSVDGAGNKDGSSWSNAYPGLTHPLYVAQLPSASGDNNIREIWVSAGTYKPAYTPGSNAGSRDVAFAMAPGVKLYGGFPADTLDGAGMEVRDWRLHPTVLSGDLDGDDNPDDPSANKTDNAHHVVIAAGSMVRGADTACLDGFVVTGGYADGSSAITVNEQSVYRRYGSGIYSVGTAMRFANDSVAGGYSYLYGGGIYATLDTSTYSNVAVSGNTAGSYGGGVYIDNGSPAFTNALVSGNTTGYNGGGVYACGTPAFTNATIAGNYAGSDGGGVYSNGGTVTLRNSIVGGNNTPGSSKNIYGSSSASYSLVHGGSVTGEGVITDADPLFVSPDTAKAGASTAGGDYRLQPCSPAVDAGNNDLSSAATDLDGNPRKRGYVDMGAYESSYQSYLGGVGEVIHVSDNGIVYVSASGNGLKDGSSWDNAYSGLADPLYFAQSQQRCGDNSIKEIWVSEGTYKPAYALASGTDPRDTTFTMAPGVKLYGGFPASATDGDGMEARDWRQHPTVLSGDLGGDDSPDDPSANKADNAYHVVVAAGSMASGADTACLDGFVVTGGYADG